MLMLFTVEPRDTPFLLELKIICLFLLFPSYQFFRNCQTELSNPVSTTFLTVPCEITFQSQFVVVVLNKDMSFGFKKPCCPKAQLL